MRREGRDDFGAQSIVKERLVWVCLECKWYEHLVPAACWDEGIQEKGRGKQKP